MSKDLICPICSKKFPFDERLECYTVYTVYKEYCDLDGNAEEQWLVNNDKERIIRVCPSCYTKQVVPCVKSKNSIPLIVPENQMPALFSILDRGLKEYMPQDLAQIAPKIVKSLMEQFYQFKTGLTIFGFKIESSEQVGRQN